MKKELLMLVGIGILLISSCKKDDLIIPAVEKETLKREDKGILCNCGGGAWDLKGSDSTIKNLPPSDSTATTPKTKPGQPANPGRRN